MFYKLPIDIQNHIYSFDSTNYDKYNIVISDINKLPIFLEYDYEYDMYQFYLKGRGIFVFSSITGTCYKDAFKKASTKPLSTKPLLSSSKSLS